MLNYSREPLPADALEEAYDDLVHLNTSPEWSLANRETAAFTTIANWLHEMHPTDKDALPPSPVLQGKNAAIDHETQQVHIDLSPGDRYGFYIVSLGLAVDRKGEQMHSNTHIIDLSLDRDQRKSLRGKKNTALDPTLLMTAPEGHATVFHSSLEHVAPIIDPQGTRAYFSEFYAASEPFISFDAPTD